MKKIFKIKFFLILFFVIFFLPPNLMKACWWNCGPSGLSWQWGQVAKGPGFNQGKSVKVDYEGNAYVVGYFTGPTTFGPENEITLSPSGEATGHMFLAKYNPEGKVLWIRQAGGDGLYATAAGFDLSLDTEGNAYVTGVFNQEMNFDNAVELVSAGKEDIFIARYDKDGNFEWAQRAGSQNLNAATEYQYEAGLSIEVGNEAVYVSGTFAEIATFGEGSSAPSLTSKGYNDLFLAAYSYKGELLWLTSAGGSLSSDTPLGLSVDEQENIALTGYFNNDIHFGDKVLSTSQWKAGFVAQYSKQGDVNWAKTVNEIFFGAADKVSSGNGIVSDALGNLYLTGSFKDSEGAFHERTFIAKLTPAGSLKWLRTSNDGSNSYGINLAIDGQKNIYVTGAFTTPFFLGNMMSTLLNGNGGRSLFLHKLDQDGNFLDKNEATVTTGWIPFGFWGYNQVGIDINGKKGHLYLTTGFHGSLHLGPNILLISASDDLFSSNMVLSRLQ